MTAKEKAIEIINKYQYAVRFDESETAYFANMHSVKECALILVDEIIKNQDNVLDIMRYKLILGGIKSITMQSDYWNNVKRYIENYEV